MTMPLRSLRAPLACLTLLGLGGCFQSQELSLTAPASTPLSAELVRATDCDDLLTRLRADATARVDLQAWRLAESYSQYSPGGPTTIYDAGIAPMPAVDVGAAYAGGGTPRHTETNTQVAGVDEGDFVETDGQRIYLLHDRELIILSVSPVGTATELSRTEIEGTPRSMFVDAGKAVVFSDLWTYGTGGVPIAADVAFPYWGASVSETKISVFDVAGATPALLSERYVEGSFIDARRHGDVVRALVQFDGMVRYEWKDTPTPYDGSGNLIGKSAFTERLIAWRNERAAEIEAATLSDFLPDQALGDAGVRTPQTVACDGTYLPAPGQIDDGLLSVVTFSTNAPDIAQTTTIMGRAGVVYASQDWLVVSQSDYRYDIFVGVPTEESALHAFSLADSTTRYAASAKVRGSVPNQFAIDESVGVLRVVSSESMRPAIDPTVGPTPIFVAPSSTTVSHVTTFQTGPSSLVELGRGPDLGEGEQLRSVRFVDDRAYVVTFRQIDPLFVVDVADPTQPTLRGEVEIPGFSTYMHPLDATHLLTIGTEVDPLTNATIGLSLQIFDVGDPAAPTQTQKTVMPMSSSAAQYDHHAFVFDAETGLLAIPIESYGVSFESALALFDVSLTAGITQRGTIAHTSYYADCNTTPAGSAFPVYGCSYPATMRRGLFIGSEVYAISYRAVTAHPLSSLGTVDATYTLPAPAFTYDGFGFVRAL